MGAFHTGVLSRGHAVRFRSVLMSALLAAAVLLPGCRSAPRTPEAAAAPADATPDLALDRATENDAPWAADRTASDAQRIAGHSVEGRPIRYSVHGAGPDTVLLLATIHGDEDAGTPLLERLAEKLDAAPAWTASLRVVIVPVLNPDGLVARRRHNARGVDLNRNFPAANRRERASSGTEPLSEPESAALHDLIDRYQPLRVVSIHGWIGLVDWDGPGESLAEAVGAVCGLPARQIGSRPGSLGSFVGVDRSVPILTLELPSSAKPLDDDALWSRYGDALLTFIRWTPDHSS